MKSYLKKLYDIILAYPLILLLVLAAAIRLVYLFDWHTLWWDAGVYTGMGKWLWSQGTLGLWEDIRPVLWPAILGFFWKIKMNPIGLGRALTFALSIANIFLVFQIGKKVFNKRVATVATAIFAVSPIFFFLGFHNYTEIPSLFFTLLGVLVFLNKRYYLAGVFIGLAFLIRFPIALFGIPLAIILLWGKEWKRAGTLLGGFLTLFIPLMVFNWVLYGVPLLTLLKGQQIVGQVLGCTVLRFKPWYNYLYLIWIEHFFHVLALPGLYFTLKKINKNKALIALAVIIPLAYFMIVPCRDYRYLINVLPFIALLTAFGADEIINRFKKNWRPALFVFVLIAVIIIGGIQTIGYYRAHEQVVPDAAAEGYFSALDGVETTKEIWVAHPNIAAYTDLPLKKIYYPVYNAQVAASFHNHLMTNTGNISYVAIDNCGGGMICLPDDEQCIQETQKIKSFLAENFSIVYNQSTGRCWYEIYKS